jgi:hypothetical protein
MAAPDCFSALCHAIDKGLLLLPILADWLEETGDPRAEGLRLVVALMPQLSYTTSGWVAYGLLPDRVWGRLEKFPAFATPSLAYLALAEALVPVSADTTKGD